MNHPIDPSPPETVARLRGAGFFRGLHRCLPLGRKYHHFITMLNPPSGLVGIPFGNFEVVHPASWGSEIAAILFQGEDLTPEFRLVPPVIRQLKPGSIVDVGANIGMYELMLRKITPRPIIAYEPQPFLCDLVRRNVSHNRLADVDVRLLACGSQRGEISFQTGINGAVVPNESPTGNSPGDGHVSPAGSAAIDREAEATRRRRPVIRVPVTTLDEDLAGQQVAFLKIDCEGFEQEILLGAMNLLQTQRPHLLVELHPQEIEKLGGSSQKVLDLLRPLYELEMWDFYTQRRYPRIVRSAMKHRRPRGHRFGSEAELLHACATPPRPFQLYLLAHPRA